MRTPGELAVGQPGTTWDNLFCEVVPPLYVEFTALMKRWDGWYDLLTHSHTIGNFKLFPLVQRVTKRSYRLSPFNASS